VLGALLIGGTLPSIAAPPLVKGEAAIAVENGFARLVFTFADDVEPEAKIANNIILITFKRPVDVSIAKLDVNSGGVISAARRDPDGKAIRIALGRRATMNAMSVAEKLFIDLLPDTWTGLPPGLPREVIEELAKRAREAEKKQRQQRALAQQTQMPSIRVRVASQPTFTRYVFDLPELIAVAASSTKDKLTLTFDAVLKFDLADAQATLPRAVGAIDSALDREAVLVRFTFADKVDVRTFREGLSYIVDVTPMEGRSERQEGAVRGDDLPAVAAELAARAKAPAGVEPPQTVPARSPVATAPVASPAAAGEPPRVPRPVEAPQAAAPGQNGPAPDARSLEHDPARNAAAESAPKEANKETIKDVIKETIKEVIKAIEGTPKETIKPRAAHDSPDRDTISERPPAVVAPPRPTTAAPVAVEPAPPRADRAARVVTVSLKRHNDNLHLQFPFMSTTPAAIFWRGDTLWLVFDTDATIALGKLQGEAKGGIRGATVVRREDLAVVRLKLDRPRLVSAAADGPAWTVAIGEVIEQTRAAAISRNIIGAARSNVVISFEEARKLHYLRDPEAGDALMVVTALGPPRGLVKAQDFVEFRALVSTHGVVLQPLADDLFAEFAPDKIVISRPSGLILSPVTEGGGRSGAAVYQPHVLDARVWKSDRQADFRERNAQLIRAAAEATEAKRPIARANLARFYLARDMGVEAKGVLERGIVRQPADR
jgi:hypothetical protein